MKMISFSFCTHSVNDIWKWYQKHHITGVIWYPPLLWYMVIMSWCNPPPAPWWPYIIKGGGTINDIWYMILISYIIYHLHYGCKMKMISFSFSCTWHENENDIIFISCVWRWNAIMLLWYHIIIYAPQMLLWYDMAIAGRARPGFPQRPPRRPPAARRGKNTAKTHVFGKKRSRNLVKHCKTLQNTPTLPEHTGTEKNLLLRTNPLGG